MSSGSNVDPQCSSWQDIARRKLAGRDAAILSEWKLKPGQVAKDRLDVTGIPVECGILTSREVEITATDALNLVDKLVDREYSSFEVTLAFCKRAAIANELVNCLSEILFEEALQTAKKIDADYAVSGKRVGVLHGLPVSLKDCFQVEGTDAAIGYTAFAGQPATRRGESEITKIMRQSGAILFCKTTVPLALMAGETYNDIYGYTSNPYNRELSSGGSSGGESALLALRGSPLGVGTDVGGSIRIPASFCGLYSLKPSSGRFPTYGIRDGLQGQETVPNTVGPMAPSLSAIDMWSRAVTGSEPWMGADPDCIPMPWRTMDIPEKLCFGLVLDDGIVRPLPPVTNALLQTKRALEARGHTVIEFKIEEPLAAETLKHALYRSAAAEMLGTNLARTKQPWPRGYEMLEAMVAGDGQPTDAERGTPESPATVYQLWGAREKRTQLSKRFLAAWGATKERTGTDREIDALLLPCSPWPASKKYGFIYDNYTSLWNVLDYCATTLPVCRMPASGREQTNYQARNETEAKVWENYSAEDSVGCPVSVQLVGRRLNEEYLLGVTRVCDEAVKSGMVVCSKN